MTDAPETPAASPTFPWRKYVFPALLAFLMLFSTGLRFWGLNRINTLVFDEVYFAKFAQNYRSHTYFFDVAPPLSKFIIAFGMDVGERLESPDDPKNDETGAHMAPFTYRWINALQGSLIPPAIALLAWLLTRSRVYTLLATFLFAMDGLYIVDARLALTNTPLVLFGVLAQCAFLRAAAVTGRWRWPWLAVAGVLFGACFGVKWNGGGFLLGAVGIWGVAWLTSIVRASLAHRGKAPVVPPEPGPVERLGTLTIANLAFVGLAFALTYYAICVPHLRMFPGQSFWEYNKQMKDAHEATGGDEVHAYCSRWYTWPILKRPVAYYYVTEKEHPEGGEEVTIVKDIHAMPNPIECWLATIAVLGITASGAWMAFAALRTWGDEGVAGREASRKKKGALDTDPIERALGLWSALAPTETRSWLALYVVGNFYASWLFPWMMVKRCMFYYHYMEAYVFALFALAYLLERWREIGNAGEIPIGKRRVGAGDALLATLCAAVFVAFVIWLPIFLGLPITSDAFYRRMLFTSWI